MAKMEETLEDINGEKTTVVTCGLSLKEAQETPPEEIVLVIPGNPGVTGFYKLFLVSLYEKSKIPVWVVGHAGHEITPERNKHPLTPLKGNEDKFGLAGQVAHKLDFVEKFVPANTKLRVVGHSIGSFMIIEMLKNETFNNKVLDVNLLFPAIEKLAETPNGLFMRRYIKPIVTITIFLSMLFSWLPGFIRNFLLNTYLTVVSWPTYHTKTLRGFVHPYVLEKVFFMAFEEFENVNERNNEVLKKNSKKMRLFYSNHDGWTPLSYPDNLQKEVPDISVEMTNLEHSFVLKKSREVANIVGTWISKET